MTRYFEDVSVGDEVPPVERTPTVDLAIDFFGRHNPRNPVFGDIEGVRIHSVRPPGYVAHQECIFGGLGQTLTLRHDSIDRVSFMPGVVLACKRVRALISLVVGLEHLLQE